MTRSALAEAWAEDYRERYEPRTIEMARMFVEQGLTFREIAEHFGVTRQRVGQLLGPMNLPDDVAKAERAAHHQALKLSYDQIVGGRSTLAKEAARLGYASAGSLRWALWNIGLRFPRKLPEHGTTARYKRRCRCDLCREANTEARRKNRDREAPTHGLSGYTNYRCRCKTCKEAARLYRREQRAAKRFSRREKGESHD